MTYTLLVCGGRLYADEPRLFNALDRLVEERGAPSLVVAGGATGADDFAIRWAARRRLQRRVVPADWKTHGLAAGSLRNQKMLDLHAPDVVMAFPGGTGTADMVARATKAGIEVIEIA